MKNHIYNTFLDFGVLGEIEVEVFYDWSPGVGSNDPFCPPEPSYAEITDVCVFVDGKELSVLSMLSDDLVNDLGVECKESYLG